MDNNNFGVTQKRSIEIIEPISSELCASNPFHLEKLDSNGRNSSSKAQQVAGACALIWPLETIAKCRYDSEEHRIVASATLEEIGHVIGVRQATRALSELPN